MVYSSTPLPSSSSELLKKACEASSASQGLISVVQSAPATPPSQKLRDRAAVLLAFKSCLWFLSYLTAKRGHSKDLLSFYRHSLKAPARRVACVPNPPPTCSSLTTGRLCCRSFRRIQSFNSTRRLEAEYTGREQRRMDVQKASQTGPAASVPEACADFSQELAANAASHGQKQDPESETRRHPGKGTAPAPTRCPLTQLRQRV